MGIELWMLPTSNGLQWDPLGKEGSKIGIWAVSEDQFTLSCRAALLSSFTLPLCLLSHMLRPKDHHNRVSVPGGCPGTLPPLVAGYAVPYTLGNQYKSFSELCGVQRGGKLGH